MFSSSLFFLEIYNSIRNKYLPEMYTKSNHYPDIVVVMVLHIYLPMTNNQRTPEDIREVIWVKIQVTIAVQLVISGKKYEP